MVLSLDAFNVSIGIFAALVVIYIVKIWNSYKYFDKLGLKGPKPRFFFGNYKELMKDMNYSDVLRKWTQIYGKTYGYFEGHLPIIVTSDLDLVQEIFIKQYGNFTAKKKEPLQGRDDMKFVNLITATKSRWKRMRQIMNPTFSSGKLRELAPQLIKCTDRLVKSFGTTENKEINVYSYYKRFTMDSIWNCAFGLDIDLQNNSKDNEYFEKCEEVFRISGNPNVPRRIGLYFHEFRHYVLISVVALNTFLSKINSNITSPFYWLRTNVESIVVARQNSNIQKKDYVQLLIEAKSEVNVQQNDEKDFKSTYLDKKLTDTEIQMNLMLFMLAGYETTSTALAYSTYIMAKYPEEQQKLYDEITSTLNVDNEIENLDINSDVVQKFEYMDMFIKEVIRYYPIGNPVITRRCTAQTTIKGISFEEDIAVAVDVLSVHYDPELWGPVDPNEFNPGRFAPEIKRNPIAFMGFGIGPRNCIGMKFALVELKIALCKLLLNYEIHKTKNTPEKLEFYEGIVRVPKDGIKVLLKKRSL